MQRTRGKVMGAFMETVLQGVAIAILTGAVLGVAKLWRDFGISMAQRDLLVEKNDGEHRALQAGQLEIKDSIHDVVDELKGLRKDLTRMQITTGRGDAC